MAREALEIIKEAEERARQTVEQAHVDAQHLVDDAKKQAEDDERSAAQALQGRIEAAGKEAREEAKVRRVQFEAETEKMAHDLVQTLEAKRGEAVRAVTGIIAGS